MATVEYNRVAQFVRVVRAGSFTAAAAELGLPKSSLSRSVANLEAELGVRLLHRTTRRLTLTDVGHTFYDSVRGAVETLDAAHERALEHDTQPRGVVRLSAAPDFVALASMLVEFTARYPGIQVDVRLTPRYVDLATEGIDIAIRAGRLQDSSLVARRVGTAELALFAAPAYLRRKGRPKKCADLAGHDWVLFRAPHHRASLELHSDGGTHTVEITGALNVDEMSFARSACVAGAGIAALPFQGVIAELRDGSLERVLPGYAIGGTPLWVVLPSAQYVPRRVALLRDFLADRLPALGAYRAGKAVRSK